MVHLLQTSSSVWQRRVSLKNSFTAVVEIKSTHADDVALDNVVRAGLTPKLRDVETLVSMLTYVAAPAHGQLLTTSQFGPHTELYDPPIEEFSVLRTHLSSGGAKETHRPIDGPSIVIVTEGSGKLGGVRMERGNVLFVAANVEVEIESGPDGLTLFRAFVEA